MSRCECNCSNRANYNTYTEALNTSSESFQSGASSSLCTVRRSSVLLSFYFPFYVLYLVAGAYIFRALEKDAEELLRETMRNELGAFANNNSCVSTSELDIFIKKILFAKDHGVIALRNVTGESNWSFGQSFFFAGTVVTTIGYGHVHPISQSGKGFCIAYAIIGIPLTFILLTALMERWLTPVHWLLRTMVTQLEYCVKPLRIQLLHLAVIAAISVGLFLLVPAAIFAMIEPGWHYLDALYYCFISLTTIGLGDYIPGDAENQSFRTIYKVCITGYLLMGLTVVVILLHLFNNIPQLNVGSFLLRRSDPVSDPERMGLTSTSCKRNMRGYSKDPDSSAGVTQNSTESRRNSLSQN